MACVRNTSSCCYCPIPGRYPGRNNGVGRCGRAVSRNRRKVSPVRRGKRGDRRVVLGQGEVFGNNQPGLHGREDGKQVEDFLEGNFGSVGCSLVE